MSRFLLFKCYKYTEYTDKVSHTQKHCNKKRHAAAHVSNSLIELTSSLELRAVTQPVPSLWSAALPLQRVKRKSLTGLMLLPHTVCTTTSSSSSSCISNYQIHNQSVSGTSLLVSHPESDVRLQINKPDAPDGLL